MYIIFCLLLGIPAHAQFDTLVENGDLVPPQDAITRSVARFKTGGGTCSATFLTPTVLLTAAHCTSGASASGSRIEVRDASGRWYSAKVAKLHTHPQYRIDQSGGGTKVANDVALIRLKAALPIEVRPLKIKSASAYKKRVGTVTVAGYGLDGQGGSSGKLRTGSMEASVEPLPNFFERDGLYLTPSTNQIVCPGDSGGAVLRGDANSKSIIGVNSLSSGCKGGAGRSMSEIAYAQKKWIQSVEPTVP